MLKAKTLISNNLWQYVREFPSFKTDGTVFFCKICNKSVSTEKIFTVKQYLINRKHIELINKNANQKYDNSDSLGNLSHLRRTILNLQKIYMMFIFLRIYRYIK